MTNFLSPDMTNFFFFFLKKGQRAGDKRRSSLLCSVTLKVMKGKHRQLTSAVFIGTAGAAFGSGLQSGSRHIKCICETFTLTEKLCPSCDPKDDV